MAILPLFERSSTSTTESSEPLKVEFATDNLLNYQKALYRHAANLYELEVQSLECLNHLAAVEKISNSLKINSQVLAIFLENGEEEFGKILEHASSLRQLSSGNCVHRECNGPVIERPKVLTRQHGGLGI